MSESKRYNNLSPKLRGYLPKLKPMEKLKFQLNGIHNDPITGKLVCPQSYRIQSTDRIYDPWAIERKVGNKIEYEGDYVDIAYILRERSAPDDSPKDSLIEFGTIRFKRAQAGVVEVIGGKRETELALILLFFNNQNRANEGKPWYIKPAGPSVFHTIEKQKSDEEELKKELKKDSAIKVIAEMTEQEVEQATAGLIPDTYHTLTHEGRVLALRKIASNTPDKIIDLSKNVEVQTTAFIEECLKANIIELDKVKGQFVWADDKTKICSIKAGSTPHNSLKRYFMTDDGIEVLSALEKQLEISKKSKKDKTEKAVV